MAHMSLTAYGSPYANASLLYDGHHGTSSFRRGQRQYYAATQCPVPLLMYVAPLFEISIIMSSRNQFCQC
jgi:hypothetical protein